MYYYDALGNRVEQGTFKKGNRKLKTDLMQWIKGTDREAFLKLNPASVTLEDAVSSPGAVQFQPFIPIEQRTWRIDHKQRRRTGTVERLTQPLEQNTKHPRRRTTKS